MDFAMKMMTVAVYAEMGGSLRVVHAACGEALIEDVAEVEWREVAAAVDKHRCGGV